MHTEVLERYNRILDRAAADAVGDLAALARRARPDAGPKSLWYRKFSRLPEIINRNELVFHATLL